MKFFSRSSLATGPKMRVPRGLRWASMITAAVLVESDRRAVVAAVRLAGTADDSLDDLALLDRSLRRGLFDRPDDDVPDACVAPARAAL